MKRFMAGILCFFLVAEVSVPARAEGDLSLDDLGFESSQTVGDPALQKIYHKRSRMLKTHQILGLATAIPMAAAVFTSGGAEGEEEGGTGGRTSGRDLHAAMGYTAAALYFTSAYFAVMAPRVKGARNTGATKLHRALAFVHVAAMVATPILGYQAKRRYDRNESASQVGNQHSAAAGVAAASFFASIAVLSFNF